jgi:hypothetical protein
VTTGPRPETDLPTLTQRTCRCGEQIEVRLLGMSDNKGWMHTTGIWGLACADGEWGQPVEPSFIDFKPEDD